MQFQVFGFLVTIEPMPTEQIVLTECSMTGKDLGLVYDEKNNVVEVLTHDDYWALSDPKNPKYRTFPNGWKVAAYRELTTVDGRFHDGVLVNTTTGKRIICYYDKQGRADAYVIEDSKVVPGVNGITITEPLAQGITVINGVLIKQ